MWWLPLIRSNRRQDERTRGQTAPSYRDFKNALRAPLLRLGDINRQAAFDCLMQIAQKLVHSFALGRAPRNSRDLGPETALLRIMHNDFDLHVGFPKGLVKIRAVICNSSLREWRKRL